LENLGAQLAIAIQQSTLLEEVKQNSLDLEIKVQKRTAELQKINEQYQEELIKSQLIQHQLAQTEKTLSGILDVAEDAIISMDKNQNIILFNHGASKIFQYSAEEMIGKSLNILLPERFIKSHHKHIEEFTSGADFNQARRMGDRQRVILARRKDGTEFPAEASISKLITNDQVILTVILRDVTESKAIAAERSRLAHFLEASLNEIYVFDSQTLKFLYVNQQAINNLGYDLEVLKQITPVDIKPEFTFSKFQETITPLLTKENQLLIFQTIHERADKSCYPVEVHLQLIDQDNQQVFLAMVLDITERKKAENALIESEKRFREMADNAPVLIWIAGLDTLCYYFNKSWLQFTGKTLEQEQGNGWAEGVHPEDFAYCLDVYLTSFEQRIPFQMEYRLKRYDGEYRWLLDTGTPRFDAEGNFLGYIGSCIDIHESKQAQQLLKENEEKFRVLVNNAPVGIFQTDPQGLCIYVNPQWLQMTAIDYEDALGFGWSNMLHPEDKERVFTDWNYAVKNDTNFASEYRFINQQNNEIFWVSGNAVPVKNDQGEILSYFGTVMDITQQKLFQNKLTKELGKVLLLKKITDEIRQSLEPEKIFQIAAEEI
ncbi:MAG TPA: PAS domain S-box protein, partial [Allocoleopsis sp.]